MNWKRENWEVWQSAINGLITERAKKFKRVPEHWIHGWEESFSFCQDCAKKKIAELQKQQPQTEYILDGGWVTEGDSLPSCHTCGVALENTFTDWACQLELAHFLENGFNLKSPADCYSLENILLSTPLETGENSANLQKLLRQIIHPIGRAMSFSLTTPQYLAQTKTVTRRLGWQQLQPGTILKGVRKAQGLKKGEKLDVLGQHVVVSVRCEPLDAITDEDVVAEGFNEGSRKLFVGMFCLANRCAPKEEVTRIEFAYLWTKEVERG